ncbi:hypothetical protein [Petrocella sp. FN5]|uniref:hypothetical protein n=1 Tax=Petrocella sp. FN5 TaxID=3032002 RepID=UPI0023DAA166|nr:hypothetical protein [Petrocella sp. FN5]MDF1617693.1 hypothetical protein [Petrocella sp. FN5]
MNIRSMGIRAYESMSLSPKSDRTTRSNKTQAQPEGNGSLIAKENKPNTDNMKASQIQSNQVSANRAFEQGATLNKSRSESLEIKHSKATSRVGEDTHIPVFKRNQMISHYQVYAQNPNEASVVKSIGAQADIRL